MSIFDGSFWIMIAVICLIGYFALKMIFRPYGPKGKTSEEKLKDIFRVTKYTNNDIVLWHSNVVYTALTHASILYHAMMQNGSLVTKIIPVSSVERIETSKNYEKSFGYAWSKVIFHEYSGNTFTIKLPTYEIDSFVKSWGETPVNPV